MVTLVFGFGAGEDDREDGLDSEIRRPAAEGGSFGVVAREETLELPPDVVNGT
jgi:hypothetical protein